MKTHTRERAYVSTTFAPDGTELAEVLELCRDQGIRRVELGSNHAPVADPLKVLARFDFEYLAHNYFPIPKEPFVLNVASLDDRIRERSVTHVLEAIDFCATADVGLYTFHPGFVTDPKGANKDASNYDFQFEAKRLAEANYEAAFARMMASLETAVAHAAKRRVRVAIETEGSVTKPDHLLMQRPSELRRLIERFDPDELGINLNLGHLLLASNAFHFPMQELVSVVADHVVAMELSHNAGAHDEHQPLRQDGWYWDLIRDPRFERAYKILEFRNAAVGDILANLSWLQAPPAAR